MTECATPGCTNTAGHGHTLRVWCRRCANQLAQIRADLEAEDHADYRIRQLARNITARAA